MQQPTKQQPTIAIIGLGLIGGSLALALRGFQEARTIGYDISPEVTKQALRAGAVQEVALSLEEAVSGADITLFCTAPAQILRDLPRVQPYLKKGSIISDICGVKQEIVAWVETCLDPDISYIGIHPMAGKEVGGFVNADPDLFRGAGFILIVPERFCPEAFQVMKDLVGFIGAGRVEVNTASVHDQIIAYTSDLMHIAATGLCASYPPEMTRAHTAGAFRDCTRIATIDATLWTDLFMRNKEHILLYLSRYLEDLQGFQKALAQGDHDGIFRFLERARQNKQEMQSL